MAGVKDGDLLSLPGWPAGMNNKRPETALAAEELRLALNVDIDDDGSFETRNGRTLVHALPGLHSVWSDTGNRFPLMLGAYDGDLVAFDAFTNRMTVVALAAPDAPLSFDVGVGHAYFTNGTDCGRVTAGGEFETWAPEAPNGQPDVLPAAAGGMTAGSYQVAVTFRDDLGRESGSTLAELVDVVEGGGIALENLPQPVGTDTAAIRIYCTGTSGTELRHVKDVLPGVLDTTIGVHTPGKSLTTQFLEPLPPGQIVRFHRGRMLVFAGRRLYWSEALNYGQGNLALNMLSFPSTGTLLESTGDGDGDGVYVASGDSTFYMAGDDPKTWRRRRIHLAGAVPGSSVQVDGKLLGLDRAGRVPFWITTDGQCMLGLPGNMQPMHLDRYIAPVGATRGSSMLIERNGARHIIAALRGGQTSRLAVTDTASAEVWRDGVRVS